MLYVPYTYCPFSLYNSRSDEAGNAIRKDVNLLSVGYLLVIIYLFIVFGRLNCVEQRVRYNSFVRLKIPLKIEVAHCTLKLFLKSTEKNFDYD